MFTPWELVRPRVWHPMASLEQSMMDFDRMSESMFAMPPHFSIHDHGTRDDDDDFFNDLPVRRRESAAQRQQQDTAQQQQQSSQTSASDAPHPGSSFSGYSFSSSTIYDDKGQRVTSTRRRYEDSSGRLKAVHERQIGDKKLRTVWNKLHKDDDGQHEQTLLGGSTPVADAKGLEEFEAAWKQTAFGEAEAKRAAAKKDPMLKESGEHA